MGGKILPSSDEALRRTPLHGLHVDLGARMMPFAGYEMPLHFPPGILHEHQHTRAAAGLFDVSHMGQIMLRARSGDVAQVARALERLVPADIVGLERGRQRYTFFTDPSGGILDDLMVANLGDQLLLIVNAARKIADAEHLRSHLADECDVRLQEQRALIALQGPKAAAALERFVPECSQWSFMDVRAAEILSTQCVVSRSGYSGEDGFEIACHADVAREIAEALLENPAVASAGLGARDSLRLEAGLCLYGSDIDETTTPVEADLAWAIPKARRRHGVREGGFPGAPVILGQLDSGTVRRRVGLVPEGRVPARAGAPLYAAEDAQKSVGAVTSGVFGPTVQAPIAMGYLPTGLCAPGTRVFAEVRDKRLPIRVSTTPFITLRYERNRSRRNSRRAPC
jgi:glycine cleavage system T protein (aminomethyltransferase)